MATAEALLKEYEAGLRQLRGLLALVPNDQWDTALAPGEWTARQIIAHVCDAEIVHASRLRYALAEDEPQIVGYNEQLWADRLRYDEAIVEETAALAIVLRRASLSLLQRATPSVWQKPLIDQRNGGATITLGDLVQSTIDHLNMHIAQLEHIATQLDAHA